MRDALLLPSGEWIAGATEYGVRYIAEDGGTGPEWLGAPANGSYIGPVGDRHAVATVAAPIPEESVR